MASGCITSWQIDGETMETVTDFIFLCSKITADGDCSHEIKRRLLLGSKAMANLDSIWKSRDIGNKGLSSQSYDFSSGHVWWELDHNKMISVRFQSKPFNITVIQVYAPTSNAEEAEQFYEDLQDLLELTPKKDTLYIIGNWNAKVGSQETPEVIGKFGLGVQNEAWQRLIEFCQENILIIANTLLQQYKTVLYGQHH